MWVPLCAASNTVTESLGTGEKSLKLSQDEIAGETNGETSNHGGRVSELNPV